MKSTNITHRNIDKNIDERLVNRINACRNNLVKSLFDMLSVDLGMQEDEEYTEAYNLDENLSQMALESKDEEFKEYPTIVKTILNVGMGGNITLSERRKSIFKDLFGKVPTGADLCHGSRGPKWIADKIVKVTVGKVSVTVHERFADDIRNILTEIKSRTDFNIKQISGYCFRTINNPNKPNSKALSMHATGGAIDINWDDNPFIKSPDNLKDDNMHIRTESHPVVQIFKKYGWGWGGAYGDYMHFSIDNGR